MPTPPAELLERLKAKLLRYVADWVARGIVAKYSDVIAESAAERITVGARIWFDSDDPAIGVELRPMIHEAFRTIAKDNDLRLMMLTIDEPEQQDRHDYARRGGNLRMVFAISSSHRDATR